MKVKNIMFSGVMASILMIGGAYADNTNLTTVDFVVAGVKSGINASKNYTDSAITTALNDGGAIKTAITNATSGLATSQTITDLQSSVSSLQSTVNGNGTTVNGLVKDVADLGELVGSTSVESQINTKINELDLADTYATKDSVETLSSTKANATDVYTKDEVAGLITDAVEAGLGTVVGAGYVSVSAPDKEGKITVSLDSTKIAGADAWVDTLLQ